MSDTPAPPPRPDPAERYRSPYSTGEKVKRLLWALVERTLFRLSFPTWYNYRAALLRCFGASVGPRSMIRRSVRFECPWNFSCGERCAIGNDAVIYALGPITLGHRVSISQFSHLCAGTHDFNDPLLSLVRPAIILKDDAWLGADAFVGPGVTLETGALLGARASAFSDLAAWTINVGNPARPVKARPRIDLIAVRDETGPPLGA